MDRVYRVATRLGRAGLRALAIDTRWTGLESMPRTGPVILAATHVSYPDFIFIERAALERGRLVRFMCRHDAWKGGLLSWGLDRMRHIPVDREAPAHAYLRARSLLEEGEAVGGFPEAGISYSYTVRPLMRGMAALACQTGAPIVPVAVWGTQRIYTVGDPAPPPDLTRNRVVDLAFGTPIRAASDDDPTEVTHHLGRRMTALLEHLQQLEHHRPRPGEVAEWHPAHLGGHALTRQQALALDVVPRAAVRPSWGPDPQVYGATASERPSRSDPPRG